MTKSQESSSGLDKDICLEAREITKVFPGTVALKNVNFNVYKGKVNALIGANGAGKSTLMKILGGIERPTSGKIYLNGKLIELHDVKDAFKNGIGIIHQELNLFPNMTILQNIFVGNEYKTKKWLLDNKSHYNLSRNLLNMLEHPIDPLTKVSELKVGEQQIVEIAKVIGRHNIQVLIMDEPTSALSATEVEVLFKVIKELCSKGVSIIYISHRLEEIMKIADYVTVLRDGTNVAEAKKDDIDINWIIQKMIGQSSVGMNYQNKEHEEDEILRIEKLSLRKPEGGYIFENISLKLFKGEVLGIYGLMGAGKTELLESVMGLHNDVTGKIYLEKKHINIGEIANQIKKGIMIVPEDRQREGLVPIMSVEKNIVIASLNKYTIGPHIIKKKVDENVNKVIRDTMIKVHNPKVAVMTLSGGNQQKVVIAKALVINPKVLLLDEPLRGIDIGAKMEIYKIIKDCSEKGMGIIFVSSDVKELLPICNRIIVLSKGKITGEFSGEEIDEEKIVAASFK